MPHAEPAAPVAPGARQTTGSDDGAESARREIAGASRLAGLLLEALRSVVKGKEEALRSALVALLSGGHLLVEDVPGVGKTLLAKTLARAVGGELRRVQGTPDLLPGDLTGVTVFHRSTETWELRKGPLFANVVLVDELNRATPRTQSALLEAMEERQVTIDGEPHPLPDPFFVVATQNPADHAGTFPLVEGQRDRFTLVIELGLPPRVAERQVLLGQGGVPSLDRLQPVADAASVRRAIAACRMVHVAPGLADYVLDLADATRSHPDVVLGASPRATLSLLHAAQAAALLAGRDHVLPDDVKAVAAPALAHRLLLPGGHDLRAAGELVGSLLSSVPAPRA